jgi:hypothetical protein
MKRLALSGIKKTGSLNIQGAGLLPGLLTKISRSHPILIVLQGLVAMILRIYLQPKQTFH